MARITPNLLVRQLDFVITITEVETKDRNILQMKRHDDFTLFHVLPFLLFFLGWLKTVFQQFIQGVR